MFDHSFFVNIVLRQSKKLNNNNVKLKKKKKKIHCQAHPIKTILYFSGSNIFRFSFFQKTESCGVELQSATNYYDRNINTLFFYNE